MVPSFTPGQVVPVADAGVVGAGPLETVVFPVTVPLHPNAVVKVIVYVPGANAIKTGLLF